VATARRIITDSFESIQIYSPGEVVRDADMARGFEVLNDMLDSWSNEAMTTYAYLEQSVVFVPGKYTYTIGVGGDIDAQRPLRIRDGTGAAYILDQTGNRYPLTVIQRDQWNQIGNILQVNANVPMYLFYDPQFPWGILNFFPIPNIGWTAFWDSYLPFTQFPDLDEEANLPEGYDIALKRNLAIELAIYFPEAALSPALIKSAAVTKGNVKRTNYRQTIGRYDSEIVSRSKATWNIYRDAPGGSS